MEVVQGLLRGTSLSPGDVVGSGERHVEDLRGRQVLGVRFIQIVVALRIFRDAVVRAHGDLSGSHTGDLEAAFLFYLRPGRLGGLWLGS